jgi:hypothetical protein
MPKYFIVRWLSTKSITIVGYIAWGVQNVSRDIDGRRQAYKLIEGARYLGRYIRSQYLGWENEPAATLSVTPALDVTTWMSMLFKGIDKKEKVGLWESGTGQ